MDLETAFNCLLPNVASFQLDELPPPESTSLNGLRLPSLQRLTLVVPESFWEQNEDTRLSPEMMTAEHIFGFGGTCKVLTLLWRETASGWESSQELVRSVTSRTVIFDLSNAVPNLEKFRLVSESSQVFLEVIKEEETLVPKLSHIFILGAGGEMVALDFAHDRSQIVAKANESHLEVLF